MAYIYLLDIYKLIDERIEDAKAALGNAPGDPHEKEYREGRIKALMDFKDYLLKNFNPKLPGRIREELEIKN